MRLDFMELDVHQIVADTISMLDHQLSNAGIRVERAFGADVPLAFGNAGKLQQVFLNLFLNAKDAMAEGGILRIRTDTDAAKLRIWIEDTGIGITSENVKKIYDPFFTTKEDGKGTGLGLSVSYGIIQEHGGSVFGREPTRQGNDVPLGTAARPQTCECLSKGLSRECSSSMTRKRFATASNSC